MKKIFCLILILFALLPVFSLELGINAGARISSSGPGVLVRFDLLFPNNFKLTWGTSGRSTNQFDFSYSKDFWKICYIDSFLDFESIARDSASLMLGGEFGIKSGNKLFFYFALGVQGAVNFIRQIEKPLFAVSPLLSIGGGYKNEYFSIETYLKMSHSMEKTWKALPTVGLKGTYFFNKIYSLSLDGWFKSAEYLTGPWYVPETGGVMLTLKVNTDGV